MSSDLLDTDQAAAYLGMSEQFLKQARCYGDLPNRTPGPAFLRLGRRIKYRKADLDQWLEERVERPRPYNGTEVVANAHR